MRISHIPVIGAKVPFSLYSTHSNHNVARTAALQAINGHDVTVYGSDDSPIIAEAAELAEKYGKTIHRSENTFTIKNGGSLTLRSIQRTIVPDRTPSAKTMPVDKPLYDLAIADEKKKPSDILAVHTVWYSRYLKNAGLSNVLIHAHMNAQPFANLQGDFLEVARELQCDIKDGQLVPSHPTIALTKASAQGWRDAGADVIGFINHGIDVPPAEEVKEHSSGYLLSLGRISPEKKVDEAIEVAKKSGRPLIIAGTIALEGDEQIVAAQENYYLNKIKPHITEFADSLSLEELKERIRQLAEHKESYGNNPPIIYVGKALDEKKSYLYQNADATCFLAKPEAFGLPQIESLSYGTPVITYSKDGIIDNGITGFEVQSTAEAVEAVHRIDQIDRPLARNWFKERFNVSDEVQETEWIYNRVFIDKFLKEFQSESGELKLPATKEDKEQFRIFTEICRDANSFPSKLTTIRLYQSYAHEVSKIKEKIEGLKDTSAEFFTKMCYMDRDAVLYAAVKGREFKKDTPLEERINTVLQQVRDPLAMEAIRDAYKESLINEANLSLPKVYTTSDVMLGGYPFLKREAARAPQQPKVFFLNDRFLVVDTNSNLADSQKASHAAYLRDRAAFSKSPESQLKRIICAELPQVIEKGDHAVVEWIAKLNGLRGDFDPYQLAETLASGGYEYDYPIDDPETETDPAKYAKWLIGKAMEKFRDGMRILHNSKSLRRYHELVQNDMTSERSWLAAVRKEPQRKNREYSRLGF